MDFSKEVKELLIWFALVDRQVGALPINRQHFIKLPPKKEAKRISKMKCGRIFHNLYNLFYSYTMEQPKSKLPGERIFLIMFIALVVVFASVLIPQGIRDRRYYESAVIDTKKKIAEKEIIDKRRARAAAKKKVTVAPARKSVFTDMETISFTGKTLSNNRVVLKTENKGDPCVVIFTCNKIKMDYGDFAHHTIPIWNVTKGECYWEMGKWYDHIDEHWEYKFEWKFHEFVHYPRGCDGMVSFRFTNFNPD